MSVQIGKEAPGFTSDALHQGHEKKITLSDYRGKWLLLFFYPRDFTSV